MASKRKVRSDLDHDILEDDADDLHHDSKESWVRGLYILMYFAISYLVAFVLFFLVIFQFISDTFFKTTNEQIRDLTESLSTYAKQIIRYIGYNTDELPFPFSRWPSASSQHDE